MLQFGKTPLMEASNTGQLDVVKYLVEECKADVNDRDWVTQRTESNRLLVWFGSCGCCCWISFAASADVCTDRCCLVGYLHYLRTFD